MNPLGEVGCDDSSQAPFSLSQLITRVAESSSAAFLAGVDSGLNEAVSESGAALLGTTPAALIGRSLESFALDRAAMVEAMRLLVDGQVESYQATRRLQRVDGTVVQGRIWVRLATHEAGRSFVIVYSDLDAGSASSGAFGFVVPVKDFVSLPGMDELSAREREVVEHIAAGRRVRQIAERMRVEPTTVRNHLAAIYRKLGVHTQAELVAFLQEEPADLFTRI